MSRASRSPARRPTKPLIDIGELVGGNTAPPMRNPEQSKDLSQAAAKEDSPLMRPRKTSFGIGERLSALANGISVSQPSRPMSPESSSDSKDEAFTPPTVPDKARPQSPALPNRTSPPPPRSQTKSVSPALKPKVAKSPSGIRLKSSGGFKIDTSPLKPPDFTFPPSPSSSASSEAPSNAPIPHITPTPIRERQEPPAFTVTSRPSSHATNLSVGTLAALDNAIAETNNKPSPRPAASGTAGQVRNDQQRQQDPQATVRVVRAVPSRPSREESLPVPRPQHRPRVVSAGVTISNIRVTPPPSSASSSPSAMRYGANSGSAMPLPKPFALRGSSPASSAGESSSSRMPVTPRDGSELGVGRPGPGHRKRVSVTFVDDVERNEKDARRSIVAGRPSHGPTVVADSSDDEASHRNRERHAEEKRKERRRGEAKAAIEVRLHMMSCLRLYPTDMRWSSQLGKVINGTGPIEDDDDDDDEDEDDGRPMNVPPRMSMAMGMGMNRNVPFPSAAAPMGFQGQWNASAGAPQPFSNQLGSLSMQNLLGANAGAGVGMNGGMNMGAGMNMNLNSMGAGVGMVDPRMFMAHQQAMMIAKQTYQLAVAQQAMRDAADEWERGSAISGWGGGNRSSVAAPSVLGMGMGMGMNMNSNVGANPFGMPPNAWPAGGGGGGGAAARSMYAGSMYAASEIGAPGGTGAMGWSTTNSVYGESFGAPRDRSSRVLRQGAAAQHGPGGGRESGGSPSGVPKREGPRQRTRTAPSSGGGQQQRASVGAGGGAAGGAKRRGEDHGLVGIISPPSSWRGHS